MVRGLGERPCAAGLVALVLSFALQAEGADPLVFPPPAEGRRLANGLRVVLAPDDTLSDVSLIVRYEAGQGDDPDGKEGLAHVTEHVLFGAFREGAHAKLLLRAGASNLNAHTHLDFTSFEETVPPEALELALWLEGARMATSADTVDESMVVRERTVVGHEYHQRARHGFEALGHLFEFAWDELLPNWHPYHFARDAVGALNRIGPDDVRAFATTWYGPNNASVVIAGHFEASQALHLVEKYFGPIAARPAPTRPALPPLTAPGNLWLDVEALVTHPEALMVWAGPTGHTSEDRALAVVATLLAPPRGALGRKFVDVDGGALRVTVSEISASAGGVFAVGLEPAAGISLADLLPAVQAKMAAFPDELTESDLARAKKQLSDEQLVSLETSMGRASRLADPRRGASWGIDDCEGVDRAGVVQSMRRFLTPERRVTMVVRPATRPMRGASGLLLHRDRMAR